MIAITKVEYLIAWEDCTWSTVIEDVEMDKIEEHGQDMLALTKYRKAVLITVYTECPEQEIGA